MLVDNDMKKRWEVAKNQKEKTEALMATIKHALDDLGYAMDEGMGELMRSAEEYARLSLSGCCLGPLEKATRFLEDQIKSMEGQGVSRDQLKKMQGSVEKMKRRLDDLNDAKEKNWRSRKSWKHGF